MSMLLSTNLGKFGLIEVSEDDTHFLVRIHPSNRDRAKKIFGRQWDGVRKAWVYPKEPSIYEALVDEFQKDADSFNIRRPKTKPPACIKPPAKELDDDEFEEQLLEEIPSLGDSGESQDKIHSELEAFLSDSSPGQPVVLVPLDGKKGVRPPDTVMNRLKYLDSVNAAFQLCSTTSNPLYSRHGLAIAILAKANGSIFVTEPDGFPNFRHSWFVGLDLGRGGLNKGKILAITLSSPEGSLQAYWRAKKGEDETISPEVLREGLSWIASKAESLGAGRHLYLIRDGRRPHNESLDSYRKALSNHDFTLIEYSKSGSPLIHCDPFEPKPGTTILLEESDFTALYPCTSPQHGVLTTPVKFCTPINPNGHSSSELALLLTTLCHSATLSYQPSRLPAPVQWANGLARLSYTDLQFSGWSHRAKKLVNLAAP